MNKFFLALFISGLLISFQNEAIAKDKAMYKYLIYLPEDHQEKKYPVMFYLHGSSQRGNDLNAIKGYGLPQAIEKGEKFDFIIVAPQCPSGKLWSTDNWFEPLYEEILSNYRVDQDRVYLTGVSMGGGGVFDVAKDHPNAFAALVPLCAWASSANGLCGISHIPIWTFHGTQDEVVPISQTESKVRALEGCQGKVQFTRLLNEGHGIHWLYEDRGTYDIIAWMLKHKRKL